MIALSQTNILIHNPSVSHVSRRNIIASYPVKTSLPTVLIIGKAWGTTRRTSAKKRAASYVCYPARRLQGRSHSLVARFAQNSKHCALIKTCMPTSNAEHTDAAESIMIKHSPTPTKLLTEPNKAQAKTWQTPHCAIIVHCVHSGRRLPSQ